MYQGARVAGAAACGPRYDREDGAAGRWVGTAAAQHLGRAHSTWALWNSELVWLLGSLYKARTQSTPPLQTAGAIFGGDLDLLSVKAAMRKLSRGVVRRGRASSTKMSVMGAAASLRGQGKAKKGECAAPVWQKATSMACCWAPQRPNVCREMCAWLLSCRAQRGMPAGAGGPAAGLDCAGAAEEPGGGITGGRRLRRLGMLSIILCIVDRLKEIKAPLIK